MFLFPDERTLRHFWPRATDDVIAGTLKVAPDVAAHYGHTTVLRAAHFWGQITWECGGGTELRENGHYTKAGILKTFGVGIHSAAIGEAEAANLARLCKTDGGRTLFNRTYGAGNPRMARILGNSIKGDADFNPDDGWNRRGAGALNTTGGDAFRRVGKAIGVDIIGNPDLANDPGISLWMGAEEYAELKCQALADADDTREETLKINGGLNGLAGREALIADWKKAFAALPAPPTSPVAPPTISPSVPVPVALPLASQRIAPPATPKRAVGLVAPALAAIGVGAAAIPIPKLTLPDIALKELFISPFHILLGLGLLVLLLVLIADRIIRYRVTPGTNPMSAFENDVFVAASHLLLILGTFLSAGEAWLTAYMPLFSDSGFMTFIHSFWPGQQIDAVIAGIGFMLKILTIYHTTPLPTLKLASLAPAPAAPAQPATVTTASPVTTAALAAGIAAAGVTLPTASADAMPCYLAGDSITYDLAHEAMRECGVNAKSGIPSRQIIGRIPAGFDGVVIISMGSNDPLNPRLAANLNAARIRAGAAPIVWIRPAIHGAREAVEAFARAHGDRWVTFAPAHDGVHPHNNHTLARAIRQVM